MAQIAKVKTTYYKELNYEELLAFVLYILVPSLRSKDRYKGLKDKTDLVEAAGQAYATAFTASRYGDFELIAEKAEAREVLIDTLNDLSLSIDEQAAGRIIFVKGTCMKLQTNSSGSRNKSSKTPPPSDAPTPPAPEEPDAPKEG